MLLLPHGPESRAQLDAYDWDLMLSGHVHGGQIGIPFTRHFISAWGIRFFCPPRKSASSM